MKSLRGHSDWSNTLAFGGGVDGDYYIMPVRVQYDQPSSLKPLHKWNTLLIAIHSNMTTTTNIKDSLHCWALHVARYKPK